MADDKPFWLTGSGPHHPRIGDDDWLTSTQRFLSYDQRLLREEQERKTAAANPARPNVPEPTEAKAGAPVVR